MCFHLMAQFDTTLLALLWFSSVKAVDKYLVVFFFGIKLVQDATLWGDTSRSSQNIADN